MKLMPNKHSNPDKTIISVATLILTRIKTKRAVRFDELRHFVVNKVNGTESLFIPALNFLFLLGVIDYKSKNDTFIYVGAK